MISQLSRLKHSQSHNEEQTKNTVYKICNSEIECMSR